MAKQLTTKSIEAAKPAAARYEIPDRGCRGLYLVTQPSGVKSWACRYRFAGKPTKLTIGTWPTVSLAEARQLAATALADVARGTDPAAAKREARAVEATGRDTVEHWAAKYIEQYAKRHTRPRSWEQAEGIFRRYVLPAWGERNVGDIRRRDVIDLVEEVFAANKKVMANRVLAHVSKFFKWLASRDVVNAAPTVGVARPHKEEPRARVLSDAEIRQFWAACDVLPAPFADIHRLLLLTAGRLREVAGMRWDEIDLQHRLWVVPATRAKGKAPIARPLGPQAWRIITAQPRTTEHVFDRARTGSFSHIKTKLDEIMQPATRWTVHDLRRTARSLMSRGRVNADIAGMCLGHSIGGVRKIYDRHEYLDEKRAAYEVLEREIDLILNPPAAGVITFRR
jgi:integrase